MKLVYLFILIAQFLCGLMATVTSASRMIFAFARDGGLPLISEGVSKVSPKYRTPVAAIWTGALLEFLFVWMAPLVSIGGTSIYTIVVNCDGHLPVPVVHHPDHARLLCHRAPRNGR